MYIYKKTEPGLYTVGVPNADGTDWITTDADYGDPESAARRVSFLNGGQYQTGYPDPADRRPNAKPTGEPAADGMTRDDQIALLDVCDLSIDMLPPCGNRAAMSRLVAKYAHMLESQPSPAERIVIPPAEFYTLIELVDQVLHDGLRPRSGLRDKLARYVRQYMRPAAGADTEIGR